MRSFLVAAVSEMMNGCAASAAFVGHMYLVNIPETHKVPNVIVTTGNAGSM